MLFPPQITLKNIYFSIFQPIIIMIFKHGIFAPPSEEQVIWRYLTFSKLEDLLIRHKMFFRRLDLFRNIDAFEGESTELEKAFFLDELSIIIANQVRKGINGKRIIDISGISTKGGPFDVRKRIKKRIYEMMNFFVQSTYINCWTIRPTESKSMWENYVGCDSGVAIKTTIGQLSRCFHAPERSLFCAPIYYIDHHKSVFDKAQLFHMGTLQNSVHNMILRKNILYEEEQELRLIYDVSNDHERFDSMLLGKDVDIKKKRHEQEYVSCDLDLLINSLILPRNITKNNIERIESLLDSARVQASITKSKIF